MCTHSATWTELRSVSSTGAQVFPSLRVILDARLREGVMSFAHFPLINLHIQYRSQVRKESVHETALELALSLAQSTAPAQFHVHSFSNAQNPSFLRVRDWTSPVSLLEWGCLCNWPLMPYPSPTEVLARDFVPADTSCGLDSIKANA